MEKLGKYVFFSLVIGLMLVLFLNSLPGFKSYNKEDELSPWNGTLASHFERHFDKNVFFKEFATNLWGAFEYTLFNEGRSGVFIGKEGWLFTSEEVISPKKANHNITNNIKYIQAVNQHLKDNGVELFVAVVPSKVKVYDEFIDKSSIDKAHQDAYQSLSRLKNEVNIITLLETFVTGKASQQLFLKTDTHWTPEGSALAAESIASVINKENLFEKNNDFTNSETAIIKHKGDLLSYLPLEPWFAWLLPKEDTLQKYELVSKIENKNDHEHSLFDDEESINAVLVGTSYSANPLWNFENFLKSSLKQDILNYAEEGEGPIVVMDRYLKGDDFKEEKPTVVIWEFPERMLPVNYNSQNLSFN